MKVRATQQGYYGHRRRYEGDEFVLEPIERVRKDPKTGLDKKIMIMPEQQFSTRWMEKVDKPAKKEKKSAEPEPEETAKL